MEAHTLKTKGKVLGKAPSGTGGINDKFIVDEMQVHDATVTEVEIGEGRDEGFCGLVKITLDRQIPSAENAGVAVPTAGGFHNEVVVSVALRFLPVELWKPDFSSPRQRLGWLKAHGLPL